MTTLLDLLGRGSLAFAAVVFVVAAGNPHPVGAADSVPEMAANCGACHGPAGRSSMTEIPSLAGQPAYYLTLQLTLFRDQQRQSARMSPIATALSDSEVRQFSAYFAALPPAEPLGGQDKAQVGEGERLTQANHCASCHLATFAGQNQMPRLAGQREDYLLKAMKDYGDGSRPGFDGTMTEVLHGLPDRDLAALAHYLSQLH
ncbi:MAG: c-type cytochrome [Betaproteobacteria bacterium]|nr:c-type cytochrome [Betaproteobacteria bacterium]